MFIKISLKADKSISGYTPVCLNEWKRGICIKLDRKKCRDCQSQKYSSLNENYIIQHLQGRKTYGIYPLLDGNVSYFIAADFDDKKWQDDAKTFIERCKKYNLSAYVERSRSGNGGHVWIFFEDAYPAYKSRNIIINILKEVCLVDQFDKEDSFDRLFPNQSALSGKGFGNLIALPLQGESRKDNNTVFLNPADNFLPLKNQWEFLKQIKKISADILDQLYEKFNQEPEIQKHSNKHLSVTLKDYICISKNKLPKSLVNFLRDNLNFINAEYLIKKRIGISTYKMEKYFKLIHTFNSDIAIPRGFLHELTEFLHCSNIRFELIDERTKFEPIDYESNLDLFEYQKEAIDNMLLYENGILVAPPGAGKTIIGIDLIAKLKQPALILVHKKQIYNQWVERIESFLNIPKRDIGQFCSIKKNLGGKITVGMIQTLNNMDTNDISELSDKFGLIIVDECHHIPAKMFRSVITKFNPYYLYGLTATPERKHNDEKLIFIYLGDILHEIRKDFNKALEAHDHSVKYDTNLTKAIIKDTELEVPFKVKTDNFQVLSKIIVYDSNRNMQIINDIKAEVNAGVKCLVLTERKEHIEVLSYYLKREHELIILTGELTDKQRKDRIKQIMTDEFQILLSTGQLIGEGTDFPNLSCLFLVYPFAFTGKLTQYIGRIQRGSNSKNVIYDYRDSRIEYLEKFFKKRYKYYQKHSMLEGSYEKKRIIKNN